MLLLLDGGALPFEVQRVVARAHAEQRAPWDSPVEFVLGMTSRAPLEELVAAGRLEPTLAARLAEAGKASLPRLRDRPEDLHAILSDRLAREGLRVRGEPVGIEDAAFARFLEYPFDGEDAELASIVQRLVEACQGGAAVVRAAHVDALLLGENAHHSGDRASDVVERLS